MRIDGDEHEPDSFNSGDSEGDPIRSFPVPSPSNQLGVSFCVCVIALKNRFQIGIRPWSRRSADNHVMHMYRCWRCAENLSDMVAVSDSTPTAKILWGSSTPRWRYPVWRNS